MDKFKALFKSKSSKTFSGQGHRLGTAEENGVDPDKASAAASTKSKWKVRLSSSGATKEDSAADRTSEPASSGHKGTSLPASPAPSSPPAAQALSPPAAAPRPAAPRAPPPAADQLAAIHASVARIAAQPTSGQALEVLLKILANLSARPDEPKFKQVRFGNPRISVAVSTDGGLELLQASGFVVTFDESGTDVEGFASFPDEAYLPHVDAAVAAVEAAMRGDMASLNAAGSGRASSAGGSAASGAASHTASGSMAGPAAVSQQHVNWEVQPGSPITPVASSVALAAAPDAPQLRGTPADTPVGTAAAAQPGAGAAAGATAPALLSASDVERARSMERTRSVDKGRSAFAAVDAAAAAALADAMPAQQHPQAAASAADAGMPALPTIRTTPAAGAKSDGVFDAAAVVAPAAQAGSDIEPSDALPNHRLVQLVSEVEMLRPDSSGDISSIARSTGVSRPQQPLLKGVDKPFVAQQGAAAGGSPNGSTGSKPASTPGSTTPRAAGHSHKRTGSGLNINLAALANLGNLQTNPSPAGSGRPGSSSGSILTTAAGSAAAATPSPGGRIPPSANAVAAAAPLLQRSGSGTVPAAPAPGHSRTNSAVSEKSSETTVSAGAAAASAAPSLATISSGPRSTLVVLPVAPDTYVPEWFFERTPADMKLEYQALVAKRQAGQVLSTRAYKEKQEAKGKTSYTSARVRVRFPEGVCIQSDFGAMESLTAIYDWVTACLRAPYITYELVAPTRKQLATKGRVRDADLMPSSLLMFRCTSGSLPELKNMPLLKDELLQQATLQQQEQ